MSPLSARMPGEDADPGGLRSAQVDPLLTEIDHVAIAVNDLGAAIDYYRETFGAVVDHREVVESDGVEEALLKVADCYIQLLTPTRDDSPVAKYLEKKGEGLHHVGYRVADCAVALAGGQGPGRPRHRRAAPPRLPRHDRRLRPPQDHLRHAHRARPGVASAARCRSRPAAASPASASSRVARRAEVTSPRARSVSA